MACYLSVRGYHGIDTTHDDSTGIGVLGEAADQLEFGIRAVATHFEIDPVTGPADMGVAQAVTRRCVIALMRIVEPHTGPEEQNSGTKITAEQELVRGGSLRAAADFAMTDLPESVVEFFGVRRRAGGKLAVEDPGRPMWIDAADGNLMQQTEQIGRIPRIWAPPP